MLSSPLSIIPATAPVNRRVRAFFAPVNRALSAPTIYDPSTLSSFNPAAPRAPWLDLGWCSGFTRVSGTKTSALAAGAPAIPLTQVRTGTEASVSLAFESWGKLQLALTAGVQQMNVLRTVSSAAPNGSGGTAVAAVPLTAGSSSTSLNLGAPSSGFTVGELIAVDLDYTGQTGFVGSGVSGGFVKSVAAIGSDPDYIRRITLNVARVTAISDGSLTLAAPLLAGTPLPAMKVSHVAAFCDREGGSFFQEWSALFLLDGEQGDRIAFHYPRLQSSAGPAELSDVLSQPTSAVSSGLDRRRLAGSFRALPSPDLNDAEQILCFRSYLPGPNRSL